MLFVCDCSIKKILFNVFEIIKMLNGTVLLVLHSL